MMLYMLAIIITFLSMVSVVFNCFKMSRELKKALVMQYSLEADLADAKSRCDTLDHYRQLHSKKCLEVAELRNKYAVLDASHKDALELEKNLHETVRSKEAELQEAMKTMLKWKNKCRALQSTLENTESNLASVRLEALHLKKELEDRDASIETVALLKDEVSVYETAFEQAKLYVEKSQYYHKKMLSVLESTEEEDTEEASEDTEEVTSGNTLGTEESAEETTSDSTKKHPKESDLLKLSPYGDTGFAKTSREKSFGEFFVRTSGVPLENGK